MAKHLTVRMAWHDSGWDGTVCQKPEKNIYCVGTHSLLSERLARNRNLEIEVKYAGRRLDDLGDYMPPCYWTSNAFSDTPVNIWHDHPFSQYAESYKITEKLSGYSVFTWPFRLSFNQGADKKRHGAYPPDLEERIDKFINGFSPGETIIFFYLNYDNPVSGDEGKYALVGCATLKQMTTGKRFDFDPTELEKIRRGKGMKYFPEMNWAINTSYDFQDSGVLLPYRQYLDHIERNPQDYEMLDEMKVLIDEEYMIPNFKYVASDINDDACIYLLTRLRKSFSKVKEHAIVDQKWASEQLDTIDSLLGRAWTLRGTCPGLGNVLDVVGNMPSGTGNEIVRLVKESGAKNILEEVFSIIESKAVPDYLDSHAGRIHDMMINSEQHSQILLQKLSLFSLTHTQVHNILSGNEACFRSEIDLASLESNPYLLCEEYLPYTSDGIEPDVGIGTFAIDIGMFPNAEFVKRDISLQNLAPNSPQRLRAIIRERLRFLEGRGDCYATAEDIHEIVVRSPVFYHEEVTLAKAQLHSERYMKHFEEKLDVIKNDGAFYFYLKEVRLAEQIVKDGVLSLIERPEHAFDAFDIDDFLDTEAKTLESKISDFSKARFVAERKKLIEGSMRKSIYVISGKPGSGKTQALRKVIDTIRSCGESVTLLAPTGKASLRLKDATGDQDTKTIDRLIYSVGYSDIAEDLENLSIPKHRNALDIQNLIIDESSMVDLKKLATLFKMMAGRNGIRAKRVILVGDENQLPPIGYGKPFFDIIQLMHSSKKYESNLVELGTNCRQAFDNEIIRVAEIFKGGNRYYEEDLSRISSGEFSSLGLEVHLWKNEENLSKKIRQCMEGVISKLLQGKTVPKKHERLNLLFGLSQDGHVKGDSVNLDSLQILSPYRAGYFGTLGLNEAVRSEYRQIHPLDHKIYGKILFTHSDKIIATANRYEWNWSSRKKELVLANGSIGVVNNIANPYPQRRFFFPDAGNLQKIVEEDCEWAYAITIHKSQGSEFEHTFVVIPNKRALLSRELVYTALTRSTGRVTLFLYSDGKSNILEAARRRSEIAPRLTSIFEPPEDHRTSYEPRPGVFVRSKVEYIIFKELEDRGIEFEYEKPLSLRQGDKDIIIRPDFTIKTGGSEFFLEHLGMLDRGEYYKNWQRRRQMYEQNDLGGRLVTTDDVGGIKKNMITALVDDMFSKTIRSTEDSKFSLHHYTLY